MDYLKPRYWQVCDPSLSIELGWKQSGLQTPFLNAVTTPSEFKCGLPS